MANNPASEKLNEVEKAYRVLDSWGIGCLVGNNAGTYFFNGEYWRCMADQELRVMILETLDELDLKFNLILVKNILQIVKDRAFKNNLQLNLGDKHIVSFTNGDVQLEDGTWNLDRSLRENYRITRLPIKYDPNAKAPAFCKFLSSIFRDDEDCAQKIKLVLEMIGYSMQTHAKYEYFLILVGSGANGKSVLLNTIRNVLGSENTAAVQPNYFDSSFHLATLQHKLANIITESEQGARLPTAKVKAIVSGEQMTVDQKYGQPFDMEPYATMLWATNHLPNARDYSEALFRRARIIEFNRSFRQDEQDVHLTKKLEAEAPGIAKLALDHYAEAVQKGFTFPDSAKRANKTWRTESDSVSCWAEEHLYDYKGHNLKASDAYSSYKIWCENSGHQNVSSTMFGRRMTTHGHKKRKLAGYNAYLNKAIKDD